MVLKKVRKSEKIISLFEVFLVISLTITTAYLVNEASGDLNNVSVQTKEDSWIAEIMLLFGKIVFGEKGIVSALASGDLSSGAYTCLVSKNGGICQEYPASECNSNCNSSCIPSRRADTGQCVLGTCYDSVEGTCTTQSPKQSCESHNGQWFDDAYGNIQECKKGCCFIGDNALFVTQVQCNRSSSLLGIQKTFKAEIKDELSCIIQSKAQEEGACTFVSGSEITCKFTTRANCLSLKGTFNSGYLCSNPELKTTCKAQATVGCVSGKDEIYWFDSCGNKENIYNANKVASYNGGKVLAKVSSCSLSSGSNQFANQGTCGNCNYLQGSRCGLKTTTEKLDDSGKNVVCKSLTCIDKNGNTRQNGESWCNYNTAFGTENGRGGFLRAVDPPGSRYIRDVCVDGEIKTEPCADYRNEICIQQNNKLSNGATFSTAACRLNRWQQCINYNMNMKSKDNPNGITNDERNDECTKNPDCFVKSVDIGGGFKFDVCAPKYPEGFDLNRNSDAAKSICSFGTQKCTEVWVKDEGGSWNCEANCNCHTKAFAEQMNDFCISLGDCGTKVNYNGDLTINHKLYKGGNAKKLGKDITGDGLKSFTSNYLNILKSYNKEIKDKVAEPGSLSDFYGSLGNAGDVNYNGDPTAALQGMSMMVGMGGVALALTVESPAYTSIFGASLAPAIGAGMGVLAGAAIGFAVTSMLIQFTGIGPGIGEEGTYALMAAGAAAGALAAAGSISSSGTFAGLGGAAAMCTVCFLVGLYIIIAVIIFIIVEAILGAGEIKKITYTYQCNPWQPPLGGKSCNKCGNDANGIQCSKYACQSLGQTCEFVNEGTNKEACIDNDPNDVSAPIIKPSNGLLTPGFSYTDISDSGFKIISNTSDGCLMSYQTMFFGINTFRSNGDVKASQCYVEANHTASFDDMQDYFGDSLFSYNHSGVFSMPSLDSLGIPGYDPNRKANYNLYVRCQDRNGNKNENEYNIQFCVKPGIDMTPPIVTGRVPVSEYVAYNLNAINASIYTNEPSDCKWSTNDARYDSMINAMNCTNGLFDAEIYGWRCSSVFPVSSNRTPIYIMCKDQPWLTESPDGVLPSKIQIEAGYYSNGSRIINYTDGLPSLKRNAMSSSYVFYVQSTQNKLNIDYIKPN